MWLLIYPSCFMKSIRKLFSKGPTMLRNLALGVLAGAVFYALKQWGV